MMRERHIFRINYACNIHGYGTTREICAGEKKKEVEDDLSSPPAPLSLSLSLTLERTFMNIFAMNMR